METDDRLVSETQTMDLKNGTSTAKNLSEVQNSAQLFKSGKTTELDFAIWLSLFMITQIVQNYTIVSMKKKPDNLVLL